jgi:hypothetical protein
MSENAQGQPLPNAARDLTAQFMMSPMYDALCA